MTEDVADESVWTPLRRLLGAMDDEIARLYTELKIEGVKPSFVLELIRLNARGPMTITELAAAVARTHSATSQKVAEMRTAGLVRTVPGQDARSKNVVLTVKSKRLVGRLAAEWRATEEALAELEAELPYGLARAAADAQAALQRKSFHDRIAERLARDPAWR